MHHVALARPVVLSTLALSLAACGQQTASPAQSAGPALLHAQALPYLDWTKSGLGSSYIHAASDVAGNVIASGASLIAKHDKDGQLLWSKAFTNQYGASFSRLTTDSASNVYAVGAYGAQDICCPTPDNISFLVKYDPNGTLLWIKKADSSNPYLYLDAAVDNQRNVYTVGYADQGMRIAKYSPAGQLVWLRLLSTYGEGSFFPSGCSLPKIAVTGGGNVFMACTEGTNRQISLTKLDVNGWRVFTKTFGTTGGAVNTVVRLVTSADDSVHVLRETSLGAGNVQTTFGLTKYDAVGNWKWYQQLAGNDTRVQDVAVSPSGSVLVTGYTYVPFGSNVNGSNIGDVDYFLGQYDINGKKIIVKQYGAAGKNSFGNGIALSPLGKVFVVGRQDRAIISRFTP
ncbi:hypothetical protein [Deinococcus peraridilitoris]|uniref:Beta-propeller repeat protein n=1 Tax=Deinococcus peraridilitoris (strain DSM 19664 / LMG 22246 / CIP 109416 / KR-200) TaxID=937777 RepID=L0A5P3_DEIPD|nr:hypothetical protein [Deinococcus peraridilitoris]AFZ68340.1 hypothetical protein Deipe_2878 [Deinococcus peraridilitoris DSM 19664]